MKSNLLLFHKSFKIVLILSAVFYTVLIYTFSSGSGNSWNKSKNLGYRYRRGIPKVRTKIFSSSDSWPMKVNGDTLSASTESIYNRYWELMRDSKSNSSNKEGNDSAKHENISSYTLGFRNLWPSNIYSNSFVEYDDRIVAQLVWIMETAGMPEILKFKVLVFKINWKLSFWHCKNLGN